MSRARIVLCTLLLLGALGTVMLVYGHGSHGEADPGGSNLIGRFTPLHVPRDGGQGVVYKYGSGPGVLILHEITGLSPQTLELARSIGDEGYTVFVPLLFGKPGQDKGPLSWPSVCLRKDLHCFSKDRSSPVIQWLRDVVDRVEQESPGEDIAVIGMCLTGAFPLALMSDPAVKVVVLSQPSVPLRPGNKESLGLSREDIEKAQRRSKEVRMLAFRFRDDGISPEERFKTLEELFPGRIELHRYEPGTRKKAHAVLTRSYVPEAYGKVLEALREGLAR